MSRMERVCPEIDVLAAWVEGGLPASEREDVKAHLASCDDCRRSAALAATLEAVEGEAEIDETLARRLAAGAKPRPRWIWGAGAAAAALVGALALFREKAPAPVLPDPAPPVAERPAPPTEVVERPTPPAPPPPAPPSKTPAPPPPPVVEEKPIIATPVPPAPPPKEAPKPPPEPAPSEVAKPSPAPPATETDLALVFLPVFAGDPHGDLWVRRDGADAAKAGAFELVAHKDVLAATADAAAFTVDSKASVALEKGAEAALAWHRADGAFRLELRKGGLFVDTESATQRWIFTAGATRLAFAELSGKLLLELRGPGEISAQLLEGKATLEEGRRGVEPGREVWASREGKPELRRAGPAAEKLARYAKLRPKTCTAFAATFEERKDAVQPFPYTVKMGKVVTTSAGAYLEAARPTSSLAAALKPARPIIATDGMVLRFRYRTNLPAFSVKISELQPDSKEREYVAQVEVKGRAAAWTEAELLLAGLSDEGVPVVPTTAVQEIRFQGVPTGGKPGFLEVDSVQFLRRAR
jgi:hypothetical protein